MNKLFEIFHSQKELEKSIPKINVINKEQVMDASQIDNKKIQMSYTFILFMSMMVVIMLMIMYLMGYVRSEANNLENILSSSQKDSEAVKKIDTAGNTSGNLTGLNKDKIVSKDIKTNEQFANKFSDEQVVSSNRTNGYIIELYSGRQEPEQMFLNGLKKIVKNIMNIDIDVEYIKKGKNFYIILSSLNTENEANKVIELLKLKKMISKNNGKVIVKE